jgi:hypothetical protein
LVKQHFWDRPTIIWEAMVQLFGVVGLALFLAICIYLVTL